MNILNLVDITVPAVTDKVEFYTVDPLTLFFVKFGTELLGTSNYGKVVSLYVISMEDIAKLTITASSSSNITCKILEGEKIISDFSGTPDSNTITVSNILQNTPTRITMFYSINDNEWADGSMELIWSY